MFRLTVEGFQSIKDPTTIEVDGLTVITGESNMGKSAIIRALRAFLTNRTGNSFITKGVTTCRVTLEIDQHRITWEKTAKSARYIIDGDAEAYNKLKGAVPEPVKKLGFNEIEVGKDAFWSQIHGQDDNPFILAEGPVTAAALLGVNKESLLVSKAVKVAQKDLLGHRAEEDQLNRQYADIGSRLNRLQAAQQTTKEQYDRLVALAERKVALEARIGALDALAAKYDSIRPKAQLSLPKIPSTPETLRYTTICNVAERYEAALRFDLPLPFPPDLVPVTVMSRPGLLADVLSRYEKFSRISGIEFLSTPARREYDGLATKLFEYVTTYRRLGDSVEQCTRELEKVEAEKDSLEREKNKLESEVGVCPTCGGKFGHEAQGHATA